MLSATDPKESLLNSIQSVKNVFSPIEVGIRKAAKDLEQYWIGTRNKGNGAGPVTLLSDGEKIGKVQLFTVKRKNGQSVANDDKAKGLSTKVPVKAFLGMFSHNSGNGCKNEASRGGIQARDVVTKEDSSCTHCLQFSVTWSLLVSSFVQALPMPFRTGRKRSQKMGDEERSSSSEKMATSVVLKQKESRGHFISACGKSSQAEEEGKHVSLECLITLIFDQLNQNLAKSDQSVQNKNHKSNDSCEPTPLSCHFDHMKALKSILEGRKADVNGFLGNLMFARVRGAPSSGVDVTTSGNEDGDGGATPGSREETGAGVPSKVATGILSIPLSNVERLRSTLSTVSLTELIELVPQLMRTSKDYPDKKKLFSVQDFFRYTEAEGRRFFEELDRDGDGQVTLEDLEVVMRKRKLPRRYAHEFMHRTRSHLFSKSFGWKQFLSLMEQKEPTILRAYTSLCLSKSGTLKKSEVVESIKNAGLPANEDNAVAMMRFLNADTEGSISYGHFRNFMLLLPPDRLQEDPRSIWFEAATVVPVAPPVEISAGSVLRSALAGGLSCALSTSLMHPVDTIKTRVQASTLSFPEIISKLPQIGVKGLYRGSIPAILGQFSSHGLRTGIFEASRLVLINVAPTLPDIQVQSLASFCSTFLGTAVRIPCEVLKQRLQAGLFDSVGEAIVGTWHQDGLKGFFRGTGATLCREVPFYVAGMGLYAESKKVVQHILGRELEPWETIAVGALSGGLAAVVTTPFDVMKTRMMTAPQGRSVSMTLIAFSILRHEGPLGLFKGAIPRFFWIAPLGAMNFAGYELARKAMNKNEELAVAVGDQLSQKKVTGS